MPKLIEEEESIHNCFSFFGSVERNWPKQARGRENSSYSSTGIEFGLCLNEVTDTYY